MNEEHIVRRRDDEEKTIKEALSAVRSRHVTEPVSPEEAVAMFRTVIGAGRNGLGIDEESGMPQRPSETVHLKESAGRILSEDIYAPFDLPPFSKAAMDGVAVRLKADDISGTSTEIGFDVRAMIGAGEIYKEELFPGESVTIMTGAQIPEGTDCIVMREHCRNEGGEDDERVFVPKALLIAGKHIIRKGEEIKAGTRLFRRGRKIDAQVCAALAAFGIANVPVYRKYKVGILSTGAELMSVECTPEEGKIYDSNRFWLRELLRDMDCEVIDCGIHTDAPSFCFMTNLAIRNSVRTCDVVISTGGVSAGYYDFLPSAYFNENVEQLYGRLRIRPGAASYGGYVTKDENEAARTGSFHDRTIVFGLSGNPTAAFVTFHLIVKPVLTGRMEVVRMECGGDIERKAGRERYIPAYTSITDGRAICMPVAYDSSSGVTSLVDVKGLIRMPAGSTSIRKGELVDIVLC